MYEHTVCMYDARTCAGVCVMHALCTCVHTHVQECACVHAVGGGERVSGEPE